MTHQQFGSYARYYSLLYQDKDYAAEASFVLATLARHGSRPHTLLDIGHGAAWRCDGAPRHSGVRSGYV
jgi:hypothetical protein